MDCDAYYIRGSVFVPKSNLKTCCFRRSRMHMTSLPIQLSLHRAQRENIVPSFPRGSLLIVMPGMTRPISGTQNSNL